MARRWAALCGAAALVLAGCTADPSTTIVTPSPAPSEAAACEQIWKNATSLPRQLGGEDGLVNAQANVAYWGTKHAVVLRCGVPRPAALTESSRCDVVNDIGWFAEKLDDGYRFTTIGRAAYVEVTVPSAHAPEADVLVQLTKAVAHVPEVKPCV